MSQASRIARTTGIWIFGLLASGAIGILASLAIRRYGYDGVGVLAGTCTFACIRLWIGERRDND